MAGGEMKGGGTTGSHVQVYPFRFSPRGVPGRSPCVTMGVKPFSSIQGVGPMKLILAIIQDEDAPTTIQALVDRGHRVTRIASTGGFLRQGNTTLLIGVEDLRVPEVIEILRRCCRTRTSYLPVAVEATGLLQAHMIEVEVGGATIFVLDVERFETL